MGHHFWTLSGNQISAKNKMLHLSILQSQPLSPHKASWDATALPHRRETSSLSCKELLCSLLASGVFFSGQNPPPSGPSTSCRSCPGQHQPREEREERGLSPRNGSRTRGPRAAADTYGQHLTPPSPSGPPLERRQYPPASDLENRLLLWAWHQLPVRSETDTPSSSAPKINLRSRCLYVVEVCPELRQYWALFATSSYSVQALPWSWNSQVLNDLASFMENLVTAIILSPFIKKKIIANNMNTLTIINEWSLLKSSKWCLTSTHSLFDLKIKK